MHPEALLLTSWHNSYLGEFSNIGLHGLTKGANPPGESLEAQGVTMGDGMWLGRLEWKHFFRHNKYARLACTRVLLLLAACAFR